MKLLMENWREYLKENVPQRGPSGNAGFVGEPEDTIQMTVRELLDSTYDIAYVKDVAEIDADPQHPDRTWAVFEKVKEYQEYFERNPNLEQLPPFQVKGSWLTDGAHRFNALRLATKNRPELLDQIIRVNVYSTKPHWQQHPGDGHWSKQIFENWRKFLNERMEFGEGFERWIHGEPEEEPIRGPHSMDVDDEEFGQAPHCKPQSIDPECLEEYGFRKIGEGSFREVWAFPDNPNYVLKTIHYSGGFGDAQTNAEMNKAEADNLIQTGYPDLVPKVYDVADDYKWIVVEKVNAYPFSTNPDKSNLWVRHFFPEFAAHEKRYKGTPGFAYQNNLEKFFQDYLLLRREELRRGKKTPDPAFVGRKPGEWSPGKPGENVWTPSTDELGGDEARTELDEEIKNNSLFGRMLQLVNEQELGHWDIRSGNVGWVGPTPPDPKSKFVLLDLGYGMDTGPKGKSSRPAKRVYKGRKKIK